MPCPYLELDDWGSGPGVCTVHGEPWFRQTSCCAWGDAQLDPSGAFQRERPCAVGVLVRSSPELRGKLRAAPRAVVAELQYLGPWAMVRP